MSILFLIQTYTIINNLSFIFRVENICMEMNEKSYSEAKSSKDSKNRVWFSVLLHEEEEYKKDDEVVNESKGKSVVFLQ